MPQGHLNALPHPPPTPSRLCWVHSLFTPIPLERLEKWVPLRAYKIGTQKLQYDRHSCIRYWRYRWLFYETSVRYFSLYQQKESTYLLIILIVPCERRTGVIPETTKQFDYQGNWGWHLTLELPWVTKTEFLLTISTQNQADKWGE